jgi:molybdopterin-guanine dinucleotide biosynthesis protein A
MPFLNGELLSHLIEVSSKVDAVIPLLGGQVEPLHALYSEACLGPMERMVRAGDLKIAPLFEAVRVRYVDEGTIDRIDPRHLSFFNINTRADLEEATRLLGEVGSCSATFDLSARGADDLADSTSHLSD